MEVALLVYLAGFFLCCTEAFIQCALNEFKCSNFRCISIIYLCDRIEDCGDCSDEKVCDLYRCHPLALQCGNGKCIGRRWYCNTRDDCGDNSDEVYCNVTSSFQCPTGWSRCPNDNKCIPSNWLCDGIVDCYGNTTDETNCEYDKMTPSLDVILLGYRTAKEELKARLLGRKRSGSGTDRWGSQVHRIAVALHLADNSTFEPENRTGEEIRYELTTQLLFRLGKGMKMSSHELALYIHALLVACLDPRDFYGQDLVRELRRRVEASGNYTNPFLILVLCNAGDDMTVRDVDRVTSAYISQHRPFWISKRNGEYA